jgi:hypothetical protein
MLPVVKAFPSLGGHNRLDRTKTVSPVDVFGCENFPCSQKMPSKKAITLYLLAQFDKRCSQKEKTGRGK